MNTKKLDRELIIAMVLSLFMGLCLIGFSVDYHFTHKPPVVIDPKSADALTILAQDGLAQMMNGAFFWAGIIFWSVACLIWNYRRKTRIFRNGSNEDKPAQISN
jgi:hypothetical protein